MTNLFTRKFMRVPHIPLENAFREIGRNAFVDWLLILFINVFVIIVLIIFGLYLYWQISSGNFNVSDTEEKKIDKVFEIKKLEGISKYFEMRFENSRSIRGGYRGVADPSL